MAEKKGHGKRKQPVIIRVVAKGEGKYALSKMFVTSITAYLYYDVPETFDELKAKLLDDLGEAKSEHFDPIPPNLPNDISGYMLTRQHVVQETVPTEHISLTTFSADRGISHWLMESVGPNTLIFFGDK